MSHAQLASRNFTVASYVNPKFIKGQSFNFYGALGLHSFFHILFIILLEEGSSTSCHESQIPYTRAMKNLFLLVIGLVDNFYFLCGQT